MSALSGFRVQMCNVNFLPLNVLFSGLLSVSHGKAAKSSRYGSKKVSLFGEVRSHEGWLGDHYVDCPGNELATRQSFALVGEGPSFSFDMFQTVGFLPRLLC